MTSLRDNTGAFPFVEKLIELADDVRAILGPETKLTYAADWTEYFGYQPADGSGDVFFHLDPLWAHDAVDAIGIDNYMPLSDWRDEDYRGGNPDGFATPYDASGLSAAIAGGEGFDWYYASEAGRRDRQRLPINDGAHGKPWTFRYKDLVGWWSNQHFNRPGGVEAATPTAWQPRSKPIWFTEIGCPAIDKGPNQPNVFFDPKSSESAAPYHSSGGRSDEAQLRFLEAHFGHWNPDDPRFDAANNPASNVYSGRMVDFSRAYVWCWDARPFPAFPLRADAWSDAQNWHTGHWLNGRIAAGDISGVINAILKDHDLPAADVSAASGSLLGYVVDEPSTARAALEPLIDLFGLIATDGPDGLSFSSAGAAASAAATLSELVQDGRQPALEVARQAQDNLPTEALLGFRDLMLDYQSVSAASRRPASGRGRIATTAFPGTLEPGQAQALLDDWLRRKWFERETATVAVTPATPDTLPGALIRLPQHPGGDDFVVTDVEDGLFRRLQARQVLRAAPSVWTPVIPQPKEPETPLFDGSPFALLLDLPLFAGVISPEAQLWIAAFQKPWRNQVVFNSPETGNFTQRAVLDRPAVLGTLASALGPSFAGRVDAGTTIEIDIRQGHLSSISRLQMLNGANAAAIQSTSGVWEIVQFETVEQIAPGRWRLSRLLRGQAGTEDAMLSGAAEGAYFVLLDGAPRSAGLRAGESGLALNWRIGPAAASFDDLHYVGLTQAGGMRARLPLSPVHLRTQNQPDGAVQVSWVRRSRIDADSWEQAEIPLGEAQEAYRVEVKSIDGTLKKTIETATNKWLYAAADRIDDFGSTDDAFDLAIRQIGDGGPGVASTVRVHAI